MTRYRGNTLSNTTDCNKAYVLFACFDLILFFVFGVFCLFVYYGGVGGDRYIALGDNYTNIEALKPNWLQIKRYKRSLNAI